VEVEAGPPSGFRAAEEAQAGTETDTHHHMQAVRQNFHRALLLPVLLRSVPGVGYSCTQEGRSMSDELEWVPWNTPGSSETYRGHGNRIWYDTYEWKGRWQVSRKDRPVLGPFDGSCATLADVKAACAEDYAKASQIQRWWDYMLANEPPVQP
jgi:hypothetical protein